MSNFIRETSPFTVQLWIRSAEPPGDRGVLLIWIRVGQGPTVLAVGPGGVCLDIFLSSTISLFFLPLSGRRPDID